MRYHLPSALFLILTRLVSPVLSAPPNYDDHIAPIFENSCNNCHNPDKQKGDLDLSTFSAAMRGGSGGKIGEPGEGASSSIYGVITHTLEPKMPEKGDKIDKKEADLIRAWIDGGLLENKSGKPKKKSKPAFTLKTAPSVGKPDGPPPMPQHLLLEPVVTTHRATVVNDMATSPWAPLLAMAGQHQVLLYHTDTLDLVAVLPFIHGQPEVLSFHPSGKYLLAGGGIGGKSGTTVTWEIESGKTILKAGRDFDSVLAASLRSDLGGVSFGGPGKRVKLWDTANDTELISIKKHTDWVSQLAYSPDGVLLASGGRGGGVYVWEGDTGNEFHSLRGHKDHISGLAWRSDSNLLATSSKDGNVMVWSMNNGKLAKKWLAHPGGVLALDWTRNGQLVTSGRDKKVKIWKADFNLSKELPVFSSMVVEVAFSHDGKRIFCADWAGLVTVWDVETKKQVGTLTANPPTVAKQINLIEKKIDSLLEKTTQAEKSFQQANTHYQSSQSSIAEKKKAQKETLLHEKKLAEEKRKLDSQLKSIAAKTETLKKDQQTKQNTLNEAREKLNQYNTTIAASRKSIQHTDSEIKHLAGKEKQLVKHEAKTRQQAKAKPEDVALKQAAEKAEADLNAHRKKLTETRHHLKQQNTTIAQLTQQRKGPGNQLAEAEKACKMTNAQLSAHHIQRKTIQTKRNNINKPVDDVRKKISSLNTQLKNLNKELPKSAATHKKAQENLDAIRNINTTQQLRLKHWQAAAINTKAIHLNKEVVILIDQQNKMMNTFTSLAEEINKLKNTKHLTQKSTELEKLRQQIDQSAPNIQAKQQAAKTQQSKYLKALK